MLGKNREVLATGWVRERDRGCAEFTRAWRTVWSAQFGSKGIECGEIEGVAGSSVSGIKGRSEAAVQWKQQGSG